MSELISISAQIGDRSYRIKVDPRHEEPVHATLKKINDKITELKNQFGGKDMQDYIAMSMLWFATQPPVENPTTMAETNTATTPASHPPELLEEMTRLEALLNEALKS